MAKRKSTSVTPAGYEVGRGKPPIRTRFKPGQSGNPGGRKKGSKNFATILAEVATSEMTVNENGKERKITRLEAAILSLVQQGMRGNVKATTAFLEFSERHLTGANDDGPEAMPEDDAEILRGLFEHQARVYGKRQRRNGGEDG